MQVMHANGLVRRSAVLALLVIASGCSVGPIFGDGFATGLGCGLREFFGGGLGLAISAAEGVPSPSALVDDAGGKVEAVTLVCTEGDCSSRIALVGATLPMTVDYTTLARERGIEPSVPPVPLASTDQRIIQLDSVEAHQDPCDMHWKSNPEVMFRAPGRAAIVVRQNDVELSRFTFDVRRATKLEFSINLGRNTPPSFQTENEGTATRMVHGLENTGFFAHVHALDETGAHLLIGNDAILSIDDPAVARFFWGSDEPASVQASIAPVGLFRAGETTLHAELAGLHAELQVQVVARSSTDDSDVDAGP